MPSEEDWDEPDPDMMMKSERKHEWISEPKYKRMFEDIEYSLQGVMGKGRFEWVDRRVFDQVFDRYQGKNMNVVKVRCQEILPNRDSNDVEDGGAAGRGPAARQQHARSRLGVEQEVDEPAAFDEVGAVWRDADPHGPRRAEGGRLR